LIANNCLFPCIYHTVYVGNNVQLTLCQEWQDEHVDILLPAVADTANREHSPSIEDDLGIGDAEIRRFVERFRDL
jgi:hypothetical protein